MTDARQPMNCIWTKTEALERMRKHQSGAWSVGMLERLVGLLETAGVVRFHQPPKLKIWMQSDTGSSHIEIDEVFRALRAAGYMVIAPGQTQAQAAVNYPAANTSGQARSNLPFPAYLDQGDG